MRAQLTKREVEVLLAVVDEPVPVLQAAVACALGMLLGPPDGPGDLADLLARAGWEPERISPVASGDRDALWDLVAELNERRTVLPEPGLSPGARPRSPRRPPGPRARPGAGSG